MCDFVCLKNDLCVLRREVSVADERVGTSLVDSLLWEIATGRRKGAVHHAAELFHREGVDEFLLFLLLVDLGRERPGHEAL